MRLPDRTRRSAKAVALSASGVQEIVIWPFPVQGQDMVDYIYKLAQDVLPHFAERRS